MVDAQTPLRTGRTARRTILLIVSVTDMLLLLVLLAFRKSLGNGCVALCQWAVLVVQSAALHFLRPSDEELAARRDRFRRVLGERTTRVLRVAGAGATYAAGALITGTLGYSLATPGEMLWQLIWVSLALAVVGTGCLLVASLEGARRPLPDATEAAVMRSARIAFVVAAAAAVAQVYVYMYAGCRSGALAAATGAVLFGGLFLVPFARAILEPPGAHGPTP